MAASRTTQTASNGVIFWVLFRAYSARVTILWILTVVLAFGFVLWGYVDQFCKDCDDGEGQNGRVFANSRDNIQRRGDQQPTVNTTTCLSIDFAAEGSQELVALASYPGSGNTWLRHLIEHSTGIYTGSVYTDKKLLSGGFRGEQQDYTKRSVLGVKMHRCSRKELRKFEAVILLVRNPYRAMVSEWHRFHTTQHVGKADMDSFHTKEWQDFVEEESSHWERMMRNCLKDCPRTLVVFYENLQTDLLPELSRIHKFLRKPIDLDRLKCTQANSEGKFHRGAVQDFDPFTPDMVERINRRIDSGAVALKNLAQEKYPVDYKKQLTHS